MNIVKNLKDTAWTAIGWEKIVCPCCSKEFWRYKDEEKNYCSRTCQINQFMDKPFGAHLREKMKEKGDMIVYD